MTDDSLKIIGIEMIPTKNNVTIRARIYLQDKSSKVYSFDTDECTWELDKANIDFWMITDKIKNIG